MICEYCGLEFEPKYKGQKYCSIQCCNKSRAVRKTQKCIVCGKEFLATNYRPSKFCSCKCYGEYKYLKSLEKRELERLEREKIKAIKSLISALNKRIKQLEPKPLYKVKCIECGKEFMTSDRKIKYCSDKCRHKRSNKYNEKRIYRNGKPDLSISLSKLYDKYNGVCACCGRVCDWHDVDVREDGTIVAGETYPSIDHIKPISKGGKHTWDNVQLLCRHCNCLKGNKE